ncbi:MAG TPA: hypothetical protein VJ696_09510, partial [Rhodanobacteraceae bacterium]|nr:hypothetical protein [Rhodanobacteraceae bacterium]
LRGAERALADVLEKTRTDGDPADVAGAVADACDRITDSVDTLAWLLRRRRDPDIDAPRATAAARG